jgi:hypothetical protein
LQSFPDDVDMLKAMVLATVEQRASMEAEIAA